MISRSTITRIFDTVRIEEVIGEFVSLRRSGKDLKAPCPFHHEKTPSFFVSPVKGIFKCFGCGKAGNAVTFLMEHEHYTFPEALKYLAHKYHIEVEETVSTEEDKQKENENESIYLVNTFAQRYYSENLFSTDEGKSIGLSYFKDRGFTEETIRKFQLGYGLRSRNGFTENAVKANYSVEFLRKSGLTKANNDDFFVDRVIFPVHNITGRVVAFGGRTMKSHSGEPKYINSPETSIYTKSKTLYGLFFAKKAIASLDECFLVEGYTDVISMHQSSIENTVASSGTSLTVDQLLLVKRYTQNLTIIYDGDPAGIKASIRGIDLALEEGLNVKLVILPEGEDPDSFARKVSVNELRSFITANSTDFIRFKARMLLQESTSDPAKKARIIKEIVSSIALVPDGITRTLFVKDCSNILNVSEEVLNFEVFREREMRSRNKARLEADSSYQPPLADAPVVYQPLYRENTEKQERDIIRILLNYGHKKIEPLAGSGATESLPAGKVLTDEIRHDDILFENPIYGEIFRLYALELNQGMAPDTSFFTSHSDIDICTTAAELITTRYHLSDWEKRYRMTIPSEEENLRETVIKALHSLKEKIVRKLIIAFQDQHIKGATSDEYCATLATHDRQLQELKKQLSTRLGRVIVQ